MFVWIKLEVDGNLPPRVTNPNHLPKHSQPGEQPCCSQVTVCLLPRIDHDAATCTGGLIHEQHIFLTGSHSQYNLVSTVHVIDSSLYNMQLSS